MENPFLRNNAYYKELKQKAALIKIEKPIINNFMNDYKLNIEQTPKSYLDLLNNDLSNKNEIRRILRDELSKFLKNSQEVSFILDSLDKNGDLINFYKFGKLFLLSIKDIRSIDSIYLIQLWGRFKQKLLLQSEENPNTPKNTEMNVANTIKYYVNKKREQDLMGGEDINVNLPTLQSYMTPLTPTELDKFNKYKKQTMYERNLKNNIHERNLMGLEDINVNLPKPRIFKTDLQNKYKNMNNLQNQYDMGKEDRNVNLPKSRIFKTDLQSTITTRKNRKNIIDDLNHTISKANEIERERNERNLMHKVEMRQPYGITKKNTIKKKKGRPVGSKNKPIPMAVSVPTSVYDPITKKYSLYYPEEGIWI